MLKLKLKQILNAQGKTRPIAWLKTHCGLSYKKAYNLVNHKQKSIAFDDLSEICYVLQCTPDELFWWEDSKKRPTNEWHPLKAKLITPDKDANWAKRIEGLNPDSVEEVMKLITTLEEKNRAKAVKIFEEVKQKEREQKEKEEEEQKEEEQDKGAETPLE